MVSILLAVDKFKGSLSGEALTEAIAEGLCAELGDGVQILACPIADGGDGTVAAAVSAGFERRVVQVAGPFGEPVEACFALSESGVAVLEVAEACGLWRAEVQGLDTWRATSFGVGQMISAALDAGARELVLGLGGSATTDAGAGMLLALGAKLVDAQGAPLKLGGGGLESVAAVDFSGLDPRLAEVAVLVASDVTNPLTGEFGAAAVYGPQKGASPEQVERLDAALGRFAALAEAQLGRGRSVSPLAEEPGAGAAGGLGFAALLLGCFSRSVSARPGVELVFELTGFEQKLALADVVVTGEGKLDSQTLSGKGPAGVAAAAKAAGRPVFMICGANTLTEQELEGAGLAGVFSVLDLGVTLEQSLANPRPPVVELARKLGRQLAEGGF